MKERVLVALIALMLLAEAATAQQWSSGEQELLDQTRACYEAWVDAVQKKDFDVFLKACPHESGALYWVSNEGAPSSFDRQKRTWLHATSRIQNIRWEDMQPVAVRIYGDVGLVYHYGIWVEEDVAGRVNRTMAKRIHVMRKMSGKWIGLGGLLAVQ